MIPLHQLKQGQSAIIESFETDKLPLKLIEMGCLPGNTVALLHNALFKGPLYLKIDRSHVAIRIETARHIYVSIVS